MSLSFAFTTVFEVLLVALVVWGIFNEDKLIAFEKNLKALVRRRRFKVLKNSSAYYSRNVYLYNSKN